MKLNNVELLLSDARGIYIPRDFIQGFDLTKWKGIPEYTIKTLNNPDNDGYWDAWNDVLSYAEYIHDDGRVFTLYQDGDLWAICYDSMTDEEKSNFGFEL